MQLVGAEKSFIKRPFLTTSTLQGMLGGLFAGLITFVAVHYANSNLGDLESLMSTKEIVILIAGLVSLGAVISFFSCLFALNKYLKLSLDELY